MYKVKYKVIRDAFTYCQDFIEPTVHPYILRKWLYYRLKMYWSLYFSNINHDSLDTSFPGVSNMPGSPAYYQDTVLENYHLRDLYKKENHQFFL